MSMDRLFPWRLSGLVVKVAKSFSPQRSFARLRQADNEMKLSSVIGSNLPAVSKKRGDACGCVFFDGDASFLLSSFGLLSARSPDEYGTGSGSDRVPFRLRDLGVAE
jgi:hypothetical protein